MSEGLLGLADDFLSERFRGFERFGNVDFPSLDDPNGATRRLDLHSSIAKADLQFHTWNQARLLADRLRDGETACGIEGSCSHALHVRHLTSNQP
jgi:hypothetical protein